MSDQDDEVDDKPFGDIRCSYSVEDNKLRLYPDGIRLDTDPEFYARFKAMGFKWAAKQELFVCPRWSPQAEDMLLGLVDEIDDEDYSPEERAADRAERFSGYRDKRADEAGVSADTFDSGPSAFGHQNLQRAERQARRHDRHRTNAVSQWSKAEYWQMRTKGVISHALHKSSPDVRRGRIKGLDLEYRSHLKNIAGSQERYDAWVRISTMEGADVLLPLNEEGYVLRELNEAQRLAYTMANYGRYQLHVFHPMSLEANEESKRIHATYGAGFTAYDFLTKTEYIHKPFERFTPKQYAELYLQHVKNPSDPTTSSNRWSRHYELRLEYERAMLAEEGGSAADVEMEVGGFVGKHQILKINRSVVTKLVVSVNIWGEHPWRTNADGTPLMCSRVLNIERAGESIYRAPTDEERTEFAQRQKEEKDAAKATKPKPLPLINPTLEDAKRLQAHWNAVAKVRHDESERRRYGSVLNKFQPEEVCETTQKVYSSNSTGDYAKCETRTIHEDGRPSRRSTNIYTQDGREYDEPLGEQRCKLRMWYQRIIVLTDKPQKALPLDWKAIANESVPDGCLL